MKLKIIQNTDEPITINDDRFLRKSWSTVYPTTIIDEAGNEIHVQATKRMEGLYYIDGRKTNGIDITVDEDGRVVLSYMDDELMRVEWSSTAIEYAKSTIIENTFHTDQPLEVGRVTKFEMESVVVEWQCKELFDLAPLVVDGKVIDERCTIINVSNFIFRQDGLKEYIYFSFPNGDSMAFSKNTIHKYLGK